MIEVRIIDREHAGDINIHNEPFSLFGRMIPSLMDGKWDYSVEKFDTVSEMTFPDESYDYDAMSRDCTFLGAYDGEACVGLAILQDAFFKYWYLYDLKVNGAYRGQGVATRLLERAMELALEKGNIGIYTIGQDNNLAACQCYLHAGFVIGGFDNMSYGGTSQEGKADIYFYKRKH